MAHSPHRRWRGCCIMCSINRGTHRSLGPALRSPHRDLRKIGRKRRMSRRDLGDAYNA